MALKVKLKGYQAMARYSMVFVIELVSLVLCLLPLINTQYTWQSDCILIGIVTFGIVLISFSGISFFVFMSEKKYSDSKLENVKYYAGEVGIALIYFINLTSLVLVIGRTGGPVNSLFGPLIPIQLSGMLFIEIHKKQLSQKNYLEILPDRSSQENFESNSKLTFIYMVLAISAFLISFNFPEIFYKIQYLTKDVNINTIIYSNNYWYKIITIVGMLLAYFTYLLPKLKKLTTFFENQYRKEV